MKKLSKKQKCHFLSSQRKKRRKQRLNAVLKERKKLKRSFLLKKVAEDKKIRPYYYKTLELRKQLRKNLYENVKYKGMPIRIEIAGEFGIENPNGINYFLEKAAASINFNSKTLVFDLKKCTRIWPSAITLLCSLKEWVELTSRSRNKPTLASTSSENSKVNSYLAHCGFYEYVGRASSKTEESYYKDTEIVKIRRETRTKNIEQRENDIAELLKKYSVLTDEEIELFECKILIEIFNNVTEHGITHVDKGWWLLAQYHETHKMISFCVADNGIGIRNSLMTGPQRDEIGSKFENIPLNDGEFIKLALEVNVSGSITASTKSGFFLKRYESGSRRGNGLKRIVKACKDLKIALSIISHYGFTFIDENGNILNYGAKREKVFAGTMIHLIIKGK